MSEAGDRADGWDRAEGVVLQRADGEYLGAGLLPTLEEHHAIWFDDVTIADRFVRLFCPEPAAWETTRARAVV